VTDVPAIPPDATVKVEVPAERHRPNWTLILLVVALVMSGLTNVGVVLLVSSSARIDSSTTRIETTTAAEDTAITEHRVRNELTHEALCAKADAIARAFGLDPATLVDVNGNPVECPVPLTEAEIRTLSAHPPEQDE
jgi:hypothetical protein